MLGGEPLIDDASIRDYNGGIGCHVASVLEETLLLPKDMVELWGLRRNEVFLQAKRCLEWYVLLFFQPLFFLLGITLILCYLCIYKLLLLYLFIYLFIIIIIFCVCFVVVFFFF